MADQFGNYIAAFLMAGGVGIIASLMPFLLLCFKRESVKNNIDEIEIEQEVQLKDVVEWDEEKAHKAHQRPSSSIMVLESSI